MKNRMLFPDKAGPIPIPVEGYIGQAEKQKAMRMHFCHMRVWDTMLIL